MAATMHIQLYDRMAGDAQLVGDLALFLGGPAIFSAPPLPERASLPAIVIEGPDDESPADTKTTTGRTMTRGITIYTDADGAIDKIERIADRVVALFHRQPLPGGWRTTAFGPTHVPTDGTIYGRRVTIEAAT